MLFIFGTQRHVHRLLTYMYSVHTTKFMPVAFLFSLGLRLATEVALDLDWDDLSSELSAIDE